MNKENLTCEFCHNPKNNKLFECIECKKDNMDHLLCDECKEDHILANFENITSFRRIR